ncbi:HdeD family acid-resistance protein [Solitalea lacus]|uniref:HdeD family acid-resistance protein n=1 Tax=Solitalea lacus TaxID=2911172 RepID=UPI001EDADC5A|nr:HdeD family acid-resistance protein [Solitalea lacus]UKJ06721.1 HdeD family acid-resistance protein [Solitalea lacus]
MKTLLNRTWWSLLIRGMLSLIFGIIAISWSGIALQSLLYLFAFYAIADGISSIAVSLQHRKVFNWVGMLLIGIISLLVGILTLIYPALSAIYLVIFMGFRALFNGIWEVLAAVRLRKEIENEAWLALNGIISILFGLWVILNPGAGALALIWLIAAYAVTIGFILIILAFKARSWSRQLLV